MTRPRPNGDRATCRQRRSGAAQSLHGLACAPNAAVCFSALPGFSHSLYTMMIGCQTGPGRRAPQAQGRGRTPDAGRRTPDAAGAGTEHPTPARDDACVVATRYITTFKWQVNVNAGRHRVFRVLSSPKLPPCLSNTRNRTIVLIVFVYGNRPDSRDSGRKKSSEHRRCISRDSGRKKSRLSK